MFGKAVLMLGLLMFGRSFDSAAGDAGGTALERYRKADRFFNFPEPTPRTDSTALAGFSEVIKLLERERIADTVLFQSYLKTGILQDVYGNYVAARDAYLRAFHVHRLNKQWTDSLLYALSIYVGSDYYHLNQFDSANYFLFNAETLSKKYPSVPEKERLYNVWGALFYESGNYRQSCNYFRKALEIVKSKKPFDKISAINFENNIAASYYRQEQYGQALAIYGRLLKYGLFTSHTYANIGKSYVAMGQHEKALTCFRKVNASEVPGVYNDIAHTLLLLNRTDEAAAALSQFNSRYLSKGSKINSVDAGLYHQYTAQLLQNRQQFTAALTSLQQAIVIFSGNFQNRDIYANPQGFTGSFASYKLLEALQLKAAAFERLFGADHRIASLKASLDTYQSAVSLLRYIEKSYDTDDARILLKKNNAALYEAAFAVCLQLHQLQPDGGYLQQAFLLAEKNKASVIAQQLNEHRFKQMRGIDPVLLQKERQLKYNIARLNMKGSQASDQQTYESVGRAKMQVEIELSKLQQEIEKNNTYYRLKYDGAVPGIAQIRQALGADQALLSLYAAGGRLHVFSVTRNLFRHVQIDSLDTLRQLTEQWIQSLQSATAGRRFSNSETGTQLNRRLVQPIQSVTGGKQEWIIIPDDMLHFLPFESLPENNGDPLLESTVISYHFSSQLLITAPAAEAEANNRSYSVLAFAPFNDAAKTVAGNRLSRLPHSANETAGLPGVQYTGPSATKTRFLQHLNQYPILHLGTHAVADIDNSGGSFLAFYPSENGEEDKLYADELYGLDMDSTELVILSACETGNGKLIDREGVMSLSRGFSYAGCASIIHSLWKSDDLASSLILKKFHHYLQKGLSKSKALQQAKLDYLHSDVLYKSPGYWANLILIGNTEEVVAMPSQPAVLWCIGWLIGAAVLYQLLAPVLYSRIFLLRPRKSITFLW